jgi:hypothetical protein
MATSNYITDSEFHMWRALLAFAFVDKVLSVEEQAVLRAHVTRDELTPHQRKILKADFKSPPNVKTMYKKITAPEDQVRFCVLARALVWCEGDMDKQEEYILKHLGCLDSDEGRKTLSQSRDDVYLHLYHMQYQKAGMAGLLTRQRLSLHI